MNKKRLYPATLLVVAISIWVYNFSTIKNGIRIDKNISNVTKGRSEIIAGALPVIDKTERNLFLPIKASPKIVVTKKVIKPSADTIVLPNLVLDGIMLDPNKPMASLNSTMVSEGDFIDEIKIKKIHSDNIEVEYRGKTFVIR